MKNRFTLRLNILRLFILLQIWSCYIFLKQTDGFIYLYDGGFDYTKNLQSSGGEDEASIFFVMLFYITYFMLSLILWSNRVLLRLLVFTIIMHILSLSLIQMGSIYQTIIQDKNLWLLFIMINPILMFLILLIKNKNNLSIKLF
jgi:hypothetical protein